MDGLCWWDKALSLLDVKSSWGNMKMNLQMIRKAFAPGVVYITAPLLVVGVQKIECTPVITNDIDCDLQDPTGGQTYNLNRVTVSQHVFVALTLNRRRERSHPEGLVCGLWKIFASRDCVGVAATVGTEREFKMRRHHH